ncbi:hypothetical protein Deipr_2305 (plasmid) [Deinococcus proteolyticus MRP]|uniref:Uncharacterized protein n=1 Tax=Deinococcus proteolyticus (strain ATCC 35074 / DSM 20540 / JCM 6276 / NBRC 101906 / NCIMB 13154 / VKM Ac-1939 / CCM 2703 / MRP) TaxID=693977 RepID=F0RQ71_DEIPM|nr:hypothetical protein [Deinococcus proteolyticus]ADY27430.1 hypothetical protein Deipr_2305 [Deinococcus proteolyticus MRP]
MNNVTNTAPAPLALPSPLDAALKRLRDAAQHHNTWTVPHSQDNERPISVSAEGEHIVLRSEDREERFTADGLIIHGRGGSFNLEYAQDEAMALDTVMPLNRPVDLLGSEGEGHMARLYRWLAEAGFTVHSSWMRRWRYHFMAWLLRASRVEADGRETVLWFTEREADWEGGSDELYAGTHWLATFLSPHDQESWALFSMTDEELRADEQTYGITLTPQPDALEMYGWRLSHAALDALIQAAQNGTLKDAAIPDGVPSSFYRENLYLQHVLHRVSREEAIQERQRQEQERQERERQERQRLSQSPVTVTHGGETDPDDLPF